MNRSHKLMTSFILSVLLLSGFLYMQQEMTAKESLRSPSNTDEGSAEEGPDDVLDVTDTEPESNTPITGPQRTQEEIKKAVRDVTDVPRGQPEARPVHVPSHFHQKQANSEEPLFYEDRSNAPAKSPAGHSFVLLKPLNKDIDSELKTFYGYHLSQYGSKHQHFVIANITIIENGQPLSYATLYNNEPTNDFLSVSNRGPRFRLMDILHGKHLLSPIPINERDNLNTAAQADESTRAQERRNADVALVRSLPTGVDTFDVTMFDGLLVTPTDFQRHAIQVRGSDLIFTPTPVTTELSRARSARFNRIERFEHIDKDLELVSPNTEYVAVKYEETTISYYLIHRIKGARSYQQIVQVKFERPVNLINMKAYEISKFNTTNLEVLTEGRNSSLYPSENFQYALTVNSQPVKFKVVKNVLWLPMDSESE